MLEVYNQLVHAYYPNYKSSPAMRQKDSKNIYKSILSINKKSPLYKLQMTNEKQQFTINIKDAALFLKDQLDYVAESDNSIFSSYKVISSDDDTASVMIINNDPELMPEQISLKVNHMAGPQINTSYEVPSSGISNLSGAYAFTIDIEDMVYEYKFQVNPGSTNESILTKLSDFINKSKSGIKTEIISGQDMIKLSLISDATGAAGDPVFTLKDTDKTGRDSIGIVSYYGLDNITQHSHNSSIEINGEHKETLRNQFTFNKSLTVMIHKENKNPVMIQAVPDTEPVYKSIKPLLEAFNSLVDLADNNKHNARSAKLIHNLNQAVISNYDALNEAGIVSLPDNHLVFSDDNIDASIKNGSLKNLFNEDSGFYHNLRKTAYNISLNPVDYLNKAVVTYPNTSAPGFYSPYSASLYSGMFFSSYC